MSEVIMESMVVLIAVFPFSPSRCDDPPSLHWTACSPLYLITFFAPPAVGTYLLWVANWRGLFSFIVT